MDPRKQRACAATRKSSADVAPASTTSGKSPCPAVETTEGQVEQIRLQRICKVSNAEDYTPAAVDQTLMNELACMYPSFYSCIPWLAKTLEACVRPGARGCSPRIVKACGGARTVATLEFGRCLDSGTSFSNGVSANMFERMLHSLSACTSWTSVRQWEPVDEFTFLCKLPSLGESCVVMQNTYPSERTHIHVEYCRRSVESERLLLAVKSTDSGIAVSAQGRGGHNMSVSPALLANARAQSQQYVDAMVRQRECTSGAVVQSQSQRGPCATGSCASSSFVPFVDAKSVAQLIGINASAIATASNIKEQDASPGPDDAECGSSSTSSSSPAASSNAGLSARREREIRAAATATITRNLLMRTAEYALRDAMPFDMRARVVRDVPVTHRALKDLVEPARSDMCLRKVFNYGDPMSTTTPAWCYEVKLNWTARGITQAERLQRTTAPRCTIVIKILNAAEMLLAGEKTALQLASLMLHKAVQLQNATAGICGKSTVEASTMAMLHVLDAHQVYGRV